MGRRRAKWRESVFNDGRTAFDAEVVVRSISDIVTAPKRLVDALFFDGLDFLRCHEGRFRFSFNDRPDVELRAGEALVIYPRHIVTIDALESRNRLVYGIFGGRGVEGYFDSLGFFDCAKGETESHLESIEELRRQFEGTSAGPADGSRRAFLTDILSTQCREMRRHNDIVVFDAVARIHRNIRRGVLQLKPLCDELHVSRVLLHRHFIAAGLGSPSDFIREKQLRYVRDLLVHGDMSFVEVARRTGFLSSAHFSTFVKRMTGLTPTALRIGQNCNKYENGVTYNKIM